MKKIAVLLISLLTLAFTSCTDGNKTTKNGDSIVIYASTEEFRNEYFQKRLSEEFPDYDITLQYYPTGNNAAKIKAEGVDTDCDIIIGLETPYIEQLDSVLADLSSYDTSEYLEELTSKTNKYIPWERYSGGIIINREALEEKGLPVPENYNDLLKPEYKGLISMPNPKASGTGFFFLKNLVVAWGEDEAFAYFDALTPNILQYTSSGSGPVNALVQGEVCIGLGMTFQSVNEINNGAPIDILYFEEGAPYSVTGTSIILGKEEDPAVQEVFQFIITTLSHEDKDMFSPEQIFKSQTINVENYPQDIPYADMGETNSIEEKERLLAKWKY